MSNLNITAIKAQIVAKLHQAEASINRFVSRHTTARRSRIAGNAYLLASAGLLAAVPSTFGPGFSFGGFVALTVSSVSAFLLGLYLREESRFRAVFESSVADDQ